MKKTFTKSDLKNGDVVLRKNGYVSITMSDLKSFVGKDGYMSFDDLNSDLTSIIDDDWDIIAVRRPIYASDCQFTSHISQKGELVYERKRDTVEEMTLSEICKALGKNIKIVKE